MANVSEEDSNKRQRPNSRRFDKQIYRGKRRKTEHVNEEIKLIQSKYNEINASAIHSFSDLPLSQKTQNGLAAAKYVTPTDIQRQSVALSLQDHDILGAAKTGSGKTLAFLLPVLERLYQLKWSSMDGLGALIISPTRELAYQIFEVLKHIGRYHDFSVGLVIGGKPLRDEAERINLTNIVICTPGRLLQHMDETAYFNADNLQILVLDEADRILDMGFQQTMNAIILNLPTTRQTLLFSATQTKSVKDLARLSLKDPMYVSVHEHSEHSTPAQLQQSYLVCELSDKFDILWSFIKNHTRKKILVFYASCKQVRFLHECFRRLLPGVTVLALHGAMQQLKRVDVYEQFCRKQTAILFATDVAARGLDFPAVHWVVQYDCPEDANTYIHRAGRTARYENGGESLLMLLPSEQEAMVEALAAKKIPIEYIRVNPKKKWSVESRIQSLCAAEVQLKEFAQRAVVSYLKSIFLMSNKSVFDVSKLDVDLYAKSMGLAIAPRLRFLQKQQTKQQAMQQQKASLCPQVVTDFLHGISAAGQADAPRKRTKKAADNVNVPTGAAAAGKDTVALTFDLDVDLDDVLTLKKRAKPQESSDSDEEKVDTSALEAGRQKKVPTKFALAKKLLKKNIKVNTKVVFNEDGEEVSDMHRQAQTVDGSEKEYEGGIDINTARIHMQQEDKFDKQFFKDKLKKRRLERKIKEKERSRANARHDADQGSDEEQVAVLDVAETVNIDDLPDPDKVYGRAGGSDREEGSDAGGGDSGAGSDWDSEAASGLEYESGGESEAESEAESDGNESGEGSDVKFRKKWSARTVRERGHNTDAEFDTGLNLPDDEALALKLLQA